MGGNQILLLREKTEILYVNIKGQRGGLASEEKINEASERKEKQTLITPAAFFFFFFYHGRLLIFGSPLSESATTHRGLALSAQ